MIRVRDVVIVHFALNPDDTLTRADIVAKCSCHSTTTWEALRTMVADGLLVTQRVDGALSYQPGPALLRMCGLPT